VYLKSWGLQGFKPKRLSKFIIGSIHYLYKVLETTRGLFRNIQRKFINVQFIVSLESWGLQEFMSEKTKEIHYRFNSLFV